MKRGSLIPIPNKDPVIGYRKNLKRILNDKKRKRDRDLSSDDESRSKQGQRIANIPMLQKGCVGAEGSGPVPSAGSLGSIIWIV